MLLLPRLLCHVYGVYKVGKSVVFYLIPGHMALPGNKTAVVLMGKQLYVGIYRLTEL
jgi:hypothetical protein